MKKETHQPVEKEKIVAETINGRVAMLGIHRRYRCLSNNRSTDSRLRVMKSVPVPLKVVPYIFMVAVMTAIPMGVLV